MQEAAHRDGVPGVCVAGSLLLNCILLRFRQQTWVGSGDDDGTRLPQGLGEPDRRAGRIDPHPLAGQTRQGRRQRIPARHGNRVAQPGPRLGRQFRGVHEQFGAAIRMHQPEPERKRRERHIATSDIQQPRDRGRIGQHRRILLRRLQQSRDIGALVIRAAPGNIQSVRFGRDQRRRRPIGPDRIDRVGGDRLHRQAGIHVAPQRFLAGQQRVVANFGTGRSMGDEPS